MGEFKAVKSLWIKAGVLLLAAVGMALMLQAMGLDFHRLSPRRVRDFILSFGVWAPLVYILAYAQPILPLPASLMTGIGGAAFGREWGVAYAVIGVNLRGAFQFVVARLLGRDVVDRLLKGKAAMLNQKLGEHSFSSVFILRLISNLPFDVQNFAFGFSKVRTRPYLLATLLGTLPGCIAFAMLGESLMNFKQAWKLGLGVIVIFGIIIGISVYRSRSVAKT